MKHRRRKPVFLTILFSLLIIVAFIYVRQFNPSAVTETVMACLAIFTAVAFFLEYHQNNRLNEAQFVIDLNNPFITDEHLYSIEHDLEKYYLCVKDGKDIKKVSDELWEKYAAEKIERQYLVNYLVHLESVAALLNDGVLRLNAISDLMAYRYFIAVNNPIVQEMELRPYEDFYRGIFRIYGDWSHYIESVPLEDTKLLKEKKE